MKTILLFALSFYSVSCQQLPKYKKNILVKESKRARFEKKSQNYMITSEGLHSTQAAKEIFQAGGNAVDAAIALSFSISVEKPQSTGIGGGGFILLKTPNEKTPIAFDFREKAPGKAHKKMFLDQNGNEIKNLSVFGAKASGVPGLVAGLWEVHQKYGKLAWKRVLQPAIRLAKEGFVVNSGLARAIRAKEDFLKKYPSTTKIFFKDGRPLKAGEELIQKDLAKTLEVIAQSGRKGFYEGDVAKKIVQSQKNYQGLISLKDLKRYQVKKRTPVSSRFRDYQVYSMPSPSSGGVHLIQMLNMLEIFNLRQYGPLHPTSIHLMTKTMQQAYADRAKFLGDMDFVRVPSKGITAKTYAQKLVKDMELDRHTGSDEVHPGPAFSYESTETTHFNIATKDGFVIASTQTINGWFGSGLVAEGTGIVMNNEMDDFATKVGASNIFGAIGGENNLVHPGKRPLSSMTPTIVMKDQDFVLGLGSPGGTKIITCVLNTIVNHLEFEQSLYDSVSGIRFHHQWKPDALYVEMPSLSSETRGVLEGMGHKIVDKKSFCSVSAIAKSKDHFIGVSDPRRFGLTLGQ